uniref:Uncharacterized protein n=1 Tax=Ditylenchus dipsaci TaxID=166011 RepID=A0A915DLF6_9BILA
MIVYQSNNFQIAGFTPKKRSKRHLVVMSRAFPKDDPQSRFIMNLWIQGWYESYCRRCRQARIKGAQERGRRGCHHSGNSPDDCRCVVGYIETPRGPRPLKTVFAEHLAEDCKRRFYKTGESFFLAFPKYKSKRRAFTKYAKKWQDEESRLSLIHKNQEVLLLSPCHCSYSDEVDEASQQEDSYHGDPGLVNHRGRRLIGLRTTFENKDPCGKHLASGRNDRLHWRTRGKGFKGVTSRWHIRSFLARLTRVSARLLVSGPWHPSRVQFTVGRAASEGYHPQNRNQQKDLPHWESRCLTEPGKQNVPPNLISQSSRSTHGLDSLIIVVMNRGCCIGSKKRPITLRKSLVNQTKRFAYEKIALKWIDTSSKFGHGDSRRGLKEGIQEGKLKKNLIAEGN